MKRLVLVLPGILATLILLLTWGIFTTPADGAQMPSLDEAVILDNQDSQTHPGWQWTFEEVDPYKTFSEMTDRSLALDADGNPHLVYGQNHLYYAWFDGVDWRHHIADRTEGVGGFAALALDGGGLPHISYYDQTHGDLRYAHFDGSTWFTATVDNTGNVGQYTSIGVDANGHPHISYYDVTNTGLKYASFDGAAWVIQPVDGAGEMGQYSSLALDGSGLPHIAYYGGTHLKYAHYTGSAWQILTVDAASLVGKYASIGLDSSNRPHISYYDETNQDLKYAYFDGVAWQKQAIDTEGDLGGHTSLALDIADRPYVAYFALGSIKTAHYNGTSWQFETLPGFASNQTAISLALDSADHPILAVAQELQLRVFSFGGVDWQDEIVDYAGSAGRYNDIVIDENNRPHISYCVSNSSDAKACDFLKYAAFEGLEWHIAVVDSGGYNASLALDAAGKAHISYVSDGELRYAAFDGANWQIEAIEALGSSDAAYLATSLAIDSSDLPHISYCLHEYNYGYKDCGALKYAHFDGTGWISATLDSVGLIGGSNSIGLDASDHPHISYSDYTNQSLKYAFFDGGSWLTETLESGGMFTSLAINKFDHPEIIHSYSNQVVRYAPFDGYAWHPETALSLNWRVSFLSLDSDSLGQPHFSYIRYYNDNYLGYALKDGTGWHYETLGTSCCEWRFDALALDAYDRPHVSDGGQSLTYIHLVPVPLSGVSIQGAEIVGVGQTSVYTAVVAPVNANEPITITWSNGSNGPTAVYSWTQAGTYPISVTARNAVSFVTDAMTVTIQNMIWLPIVYGPPLTGDLCGWVQSSNGGSIQGASVCVVRTGQCDTTDESGVFWIEDIIVGDYLVRASASGYYPQERMLTISIWGCGTYSFSLTPIVQTGSVSGQVISAVTAQGIDGASVCLASGNPCTTTDVSGNYTLSNVPTGAQTLRASAGGYISLDQGVNVAANQTSQLNFVLSPTLDQGEMRIVLTWGASPKDLDSHLWLPSSHPYHIYFSTKGNCTSDPFACLDVDDRESYGPETITIKQRFSGTYRYAVHNYTNEELITASGAHVRIYDSTGLIAEYDIPTSGTGRWWYLFDLDGDSGAITVHNTIVSTSPNPY